MSAPRAPRGSGTARAEKVKAAIAEAIKPFRDVPRRNRQSPQITRATVQRPDTQTLTCVECERTWSRPPKGGRPPRRCPQCASGVSPDPTPAPRVVTRLAELGPCRVCGVNDREERAQPDLHLACVERATDKAKKRRAALVANRVARAGGELAREDLVRRLALERAGLVSARGGRGRARPDREEGDDEDDEDGLTSDEVEAIDRITRGPGLSTEGIG